MNKIQIVKFSNGKYGIRRKDEFLDLGCNKFWWEKNDSNFDSCLGSLKECKEIFKKYSIKVIEIIKEEEEFKEV